MDNEVFQDGTPFVGDPNAPAVTETGISGPFEGTLPPVRTPSAYDPACHDAEVADAAEPSEE